MCHLSYPQLLSCAYSYKYHEVLWLPKRTQLWACFNTEPNRLYRRLRLFPSKLQEYTTPQFSRLSTQYYIGPLLTCFLSLDTSQTSLQSTKFGNRHTAHGRYEYSYTLANSRENWAQKKIKNRLPDANFYLTHPFLDEWVELFDESRPSFRKFWPFLSRFTHGHLSVYRVAGLVPARKSYVHCEVEVHTVYQRLLKTHATHSYLFCMLILVLYRLQA